MSTVTLDPLSPPTAVAEPGDQLRLERMPTGVPGLDFLLEGGLVRGHSLLMEGPPGSGKSTLAVRMIHEGIRQYDEPGLIITFEEFPRQMYVEAAQFGIDLRGLEQSGKLRMIWTPPSRILEAFSGKSDLVSKIVESMGTKRLIIDSITHFKRVIAEESELRDVLARILTNLKTRGINSFLIKELDRIDESTIAFEEYLVDSSMRLYNTAVVGRGENIRMLEMRKTRGQRHISGRHPFEISDGGVSVYPRLRPADVRRAFADVASPARERLTSGLPGLDDALGGGLWNGTLNLLSGDTGSGKSVFAYHFLEAGVQASEPALVLSVKRTPEQILAQASSLGMDWERAYRLGLLEILPFHATGLCVEKMLDTLLKCIHAVRPQRLVFESINHLWSAVRDEDQVRDYVIVLANVFEAAGTTTFMVDERRGESERDRQSYDHLANTVVRLRIDRPDGRMRRFLEVAKHTGSNHRKTLVEYDISADGVFLVEAEAQAEIEDEAPAETEAKPPARRARRKRR